MHTEHSGMQEWVIQIPSNTILVSVLFPSHISEYNFLLLVLLAICSQWWMKQTVFVGLDTLRIKEEQLEVVTNVAKGLARWQSGIFNISFQNFLQPVFAHRPRLLSSDLSLSLCLSAALFVMSIPQLQQLISIVQLS